MLRVASIAFFLLASGAIAAEPAGDLKLLQGTWVLEDAKLGGRDHLDDFKGMKLTITDDKFAIDLGDNSDKGTIKLDAAKKPKQIDLSTGDKGPFKGRNLPGIYELKDNTVVLCLNSEKQDRPDAFESKAKTPIMLFTFKREKK